MAVKDILLEVDTGEVLRLNYTQQVLLIILGV